MRMMRLRVIVVALGVALGAPASAATVHGLVYSDTNGDGLPSAGEPGIAGAVVALGVEQFVVTDAAGQYDIDAADTPHGIVWVRVPDGYRPGPVWGRWTGKGEVDLGLHPLPAPVRGPLTFIVAADTHIGIDDPTLRAADLARVSRLATATQPTVAFFTILGDITQGGRPDEYAIVDKGLAGVDVPFIPVAGNHDWYDGGEAWFAHYGPDNYSFDIGGVHFVVWNMALPPDQLRHYLGEDLRRVPAAMPIVALTHEPPLGAQVEVLRELGVDYVLTGHTHSNRVVDHGDLIELNTEPLLMGGLDFTPAGYRIVTIDDGRLSSYHHTVVDRPFLSLVAPRTGDCTPALPSELLVAAELGADASVVTAQIDCGTPVELHSTGAWLWRGKLPALAAGDHQLEITARTTTGQVATTSKVLTVCKPPEGATSAGPDWPQVGGGASHVGVVEHEIAAPLQSRWVTALGNHVLTSAPIIAAGSVFVTTTDLSDGQTGGIAALDLETGDVRWRLATPKPIRGGVAYAAGTVITTQIDGVVLALDATSGAVRWRRELSASLPPQAGAVFSPPTVDGSNVFLGHQRAAGALDITTGKVRWLEDPVPDAFNGQTASALAIGGGLAIGTFHRELGGVVAWDAQTGAERWRYADPTVVAINAAPVIGRDAIYLVSATTEVVALDFAGKERWRAKIDPQGFDWGQASVGTPALAGDTLVVPTLYGTLVALDATTGAERWRYRARPGPLRGTHYRGSNIAAFFASPVVTGTLVWAVDASGMLSALDLHTGAARWGTELPSPVMAGIAVSGDWLVVAAYDGTVRAMTPGAEVSPRVASPEFCTEAPSPVESAGCCNTGSGGGGAAGTLAFVVGCVLLRRRRVS